MLKKLVQNFVTVERFAERKGNDCVDDCLALCHTKPKTAFGRNLQQFLYY